MDEGNVYRLCPPRDGPSNYTVNHVDGGEEDAEFLAFRLINKRIRVRLSEQSLEFSHLPGKSRLLAVGNRCGQLAGVVRKDDSYYLSVLPLSDVQAAMDALSTSSERPSTLTPKHPLMKLPGTPHIIRFALNDENFIVGFIEGPVLVYSTNDLINASQTQVEPVYSVDGTKPLDIVPNPGDHAEYVAILREGENLEHNVDIVDIRGRRLIAGWQQAGAEIVPVSLSWSPKGKQIAIGLKSGDILLYSPTSPESPKTHLPRPPSIPSDNSAILSITWLSNTTFHLVFSSEASCFGNFDPSESSALNKIHILYVTDSSTKTATATQLIDPSVPFGAQVASGPLSVVLRDWDPAKFVLVCGDAPSSDIGIIGSLSPNAWKNFILEETSAPALPMSEDMEDMPLLGLDVDLTSSRSVHTTDQLDDGAPDLPPSPILYAYVSDGTIVAWTIMNKKGASYPGTVGGTTSGMAVEKPSVVQSPGGSLSPVDGQSSPSPFSQQKPTSSFGQQQQTSAFGTQVSSAFGQQTTSAFGQQTPTTSAFGQQTTTSAFGQQTNSSTFMAPAKGFGAFASSGPSKFGAPSSQPSETKDPSALPPAFAGGLGSKPAVPAFGSTGFGNKSATPTFGSTGFGAKAATPTFGSTGFGSQPAFGQTGSSATAAKPSAPSIGGFAGFAGQGTGGFNSRDAAPKADAPSLGGFAAFASKGSSAFGTSAISGDSAAKTTGSAPSPEGFASFASQGTSAFGTKSDATSSTTNAFGAPPLKSAFGTATSTTTSSSLPPKSAFGNGGTGTASTFDATKPTFGKSGFTASAKSSADSAFGGFGSFGDALKSFSPKPSGLESPPPGSPTSDTGSPPESPKLSAKAPLAAAGSTKPISSYIKPASGFGAFGGASSDSSFIKPAQGFGSAKPITTSASGEDKEKTSIPPAVSGSKPASSPAFGAPSVLGAKAKAPVFGASGFASVAPKPAITDPSKPIGGGFGAFSSGSAFGSFANPNVGKSFEDMLKEDKGKPEDEKKEAPPVFGGIVKRETTVFGVSAATPEIKAANFVATPKEPKKEASLSPEETPKKEISSSTGNLSQASSFSLVSLSDSLSVKEPASEEEQEGTEKSEEFYLTDSSFDEEDEEKSISESENAEEAVADGNRAESPTPTPVSEPSTPKSEPPKLPTPVASTSVVNEPQAPPPPPATKLAPETPEKSAQATPIVAPSPVTPAAFGFGLGRPSSKPVRSSPLAYAPIISGGEKTPTTSPSKSPINEPILPAAPKAGPGTSSLFKMPVPPTPAIETTARRPKTPPLFGGKGPGIGLGPPPKTPPIFSQSPAPAPATSPVPSAFVKPGPVVTTPFVPKTPFTIPPSAEVQTPTPRAAVPEPTQPPEPPLHPLQEEFINAYERVNEIVSQIEARVKFYQDFFPFVRTPRGLESLIAPENTSLPPPASSDAKDFRTFLDKLRQEVISLIEQGKEDRRLLQNLQNLALISETKQEELERWVRARKDPEFAKTLRPRSLGPEHAENQIKLRKALQVTHGRIQQCEDQMEALKKRLEEERSGRLSMRPPTLDTIDRTCRNIYVALEERTKALDKLQRQLEEMSPHTSQKLQTSQPSAPLSSKAAPPFANIAAAALNSERSALKIRDTLLHLRKRPLFTTAVKDLSGEQPTTKQETRQMFSSPIPASWGSAPMYPPLSTPLKSPGSPGTPLVTSPGSPESYRRMSRSGHGAGTERTKAAQFKGGLPSSPSEKPTFDWGPMPTPKQMTSLSPDVRSEKNRQS